MRRTAKGETTRPSSRGSSQSAARAALAKRLMLDSIVIERRTEKRVRFEPPLDATCISVDGTNTTSCRVVEVSHSGAQLECSSHLPNAMDFFLLFTTSPNPVYRRCQRAWIRGMHVGVKFLPSHGHGLVYTEPDD
jgi:hypothetical protein